MHIAIYNRNTIDTYQINTLGNAADFGDAATTRLYSMKASTKVRGFSAGGRTPSVSNVKEFITIASTGNGTDFGDLHTAHEKGGGANNFTRALYGGGSAPGTTNAIGFYELTSSGDSVDFGDLTRSNQLSSLPGLSVSDQSGLIIGTASSST